MSLFNWLRQSPDHIHIDVGDPKKILLAFRAGEAGDARTLADLGPHYADAYERGDSWAEYGDRYWQGAACYGV